MSRTYVSTNNSRGKEVTAMGPHFAHMRGWNAGVEVQFDGSDPDVDVFEVYSTGGSNGHHTKKLLGRVIETPDGPQWVGA